ncbi:hypothetical protein V8F06_008899 [Rhypophila decipiens]
MQCPARAFGLLFVSFARRRTCFSKHSKVPIQRYSVPPHTSLTTESYMQVPLTLKPSPSAMFLRYYDCQVLAGWDGWSMDSESSHIRGYDMPR